MRTQQDSNLLEYGQRRVPVKRDTLLTLRRSVPTNCARKLVTAETSEVRVDASSVVSLHASDLTVYSGLW